MLARLLRKSTVLPSYPPPSGLRSNLGFYGVFDYASGLTTATLGTSGSGHDLDIINGTSSNDNLAGFAGRIGWRALDMGTSVASYQWAVVDSYVSACAAVGKQFWLWVDPYNIIGSGNSITNNTRCVPDWLISTSTGSFGAGDPGNVMANGAPLGRSIFPKFYNAPVANAFNALMQQIALRYDSNPNFEGVIVCNGSSLPDFNGVDNLGTTWPQINYNTDYSNSGYLSAYQSFCSTWRSYFTYSNIWLTTDYLFNEAASTSYAGQDADLHALFNNYFIPNKMCAGGVDSWTASWVPPQNPLSQTVENAYATITNTNYNRGVYSDEVLRGWRGPSPGSSTGFLGQIRRCAYLALTEMGGYIGQFAPSDAYSSIRGPIDEVHYMFIAVNYGPSGNYGLNTSPNTLWHASSTYEATYGQSVYPWIKGAGRTNQVVPY